MSQTPLPREFYDRDVKRVAQELLGKLLLRRTDDGLTSGRIVETEAYLAKNDSACHASRGKTRRNATMFGPPGHAYVYSIHARYCLNTVTEPLDVPSAVLIRAIEPLEGIELMQQRRGVEQLTDLTRGPARLCEALAIDRQLDTHDLTIGRELWIVDDGFDIDEKSIITTRRIGVTSAEDLPLRYVIADSQYVSGPRGWHARK